MTKNYAIGRRLALLFNVDKCKVMHFGYSN
jgi:hypothetical protein